MPPPGSGVHGAPGGGGRVGAFSSFHITGTTGLQGSDGSPALLPAPASPDEAGQMAGMPTIRVVSFGPTDLSRYQNYIPTNVLEPTDRCFQASPGQLPDCFLSFTLSISPVTVTAPVSFGIGSKITSFIGDANNHENGGDPNGPLTTAPDYFFDLSKQQSGVFVQDQGNPTDQRIRTIAAVNSATVVLSSRDYAGAGNIEATLTIDGLPVKLGDQNQLDVTFPVDTNGNRIADAWERQVNQGYLLSDVGDPDIGPAGSLSRGDGLTAFDEYRGFFVIENGIEHQIRTDPVTQKDVFYLNATGVTYDPAKGATNFLNQILAAQTSPGIAYHEVSDKGANTLQGTPDGSQGVGRLNRNNSPGQNDVYAIVYLNFALSAGTLGQAIRGFTNQPIRISLVQIDAIDGDFSRQLRATTIAHETGHMFGLGHPTRIASYSAGSDAANPTGVPPDGYARKSTDATQFGAWEETRDTNGTLQVLELPEATFDDLASTAYGEIVGLALFPFPHPMFPTKRFRSYQVPPGGLSATPMQIQIDTYTGHIMDGAGDTSAFAGQSTFGATDIPAMCVKTMCP